MNKKLTDIIASCELSLSAEDSKNIASSLGINDLRKNPTAEQELKFTQVCNLIKQGQTIEQSISSVVEQTKVDHEDSPALSDLDLEAIIIQQANKAADATLSSLPNIAQAESLNLRQTFIQQFRTRIEQQLKSPEYQKAFISQIESLGELPVLNSSITNTALPSSSSSSN